MQDLSQGEEVIEKSLPNIIETEDTSQIEAFLSGLKPGDEARAVAELNKGQQTRLLELLAPEKSAELLRKIAGRGSVDLVEQMPLEQAAGIFEQMPSRQQVDILRELKEKDAKQIIGEFSQPKAEELRQLIAYPEDSAGGLMIPEYLAFSSGMLVKDVLDDLREQGEVYSDYVIQYAYVVSEGGELLGVLRLRDLLLAPTNKPVTDIMIKDPQKIRVDTTLRDLREFFKQYNYLGVPVVNSGDRLLGVVLSATVKDAVNKRSNQIFLKVSGIVGGEEFRTMPLFKRSSRRLSWLSINILLNIVAASVIALYQDTLEKAIVLAVFLPIISDMSGCSGNQAVAVSIRELTLGLVRAKELLRVLFKESTIGIVNGLVLGMLLGGAALLWKGNLYLGLVVGVSLAANTLVAVSFGGMVPLILRRIGADPALASGPLLTTITDMCGFFFVLSFASALLPKLSG
ncbi:MAG: magnesium transporter [Desulfobacteraceae bacterium]|uniref:Magnesium transporter MgtE n=1 Tax=Candidatus Desulfacyla euxinica TaxID=2841693 RepID=A0A8J6T830_9DELT|nr:magnesium transporter [Candidatus Desulfacyla euxinica]MBL6977358.1 magnesium transporter [Desulfobacteraceae bacterium]